MGLTKMESGQRASALPRRPLMRSLPVLGVLAALALVAADVVRHPSSLQGDGLRLFFFDFGLLMGCGIVAVWVRGEERARPKIAMRCGTIAGLLLGAVLAANHLTEMFVRDRGFAVVIAPVLIALVLLSATGSAAREQAGTLTLAVASGVWAAVVGILILLCVGFASVLFMEGRVELWLRDAFSASGMSDPGGFAVKNALQAASEGLVRMPVAAACLSLLGAVENLVIRRRSRTALLAITWGAPLLFLGGAAALWHANSLARTERSPFILAGVLLASVAVAAAHPVWSAWRQRPTG